MCRCLYVFVKEVVAERVITFVDGPLQAYKTVVYLQCVYSEAVSSWFVASKCMIAPLEPMTVPQLELAGTVLGLHLTQHSTLVLGLPMQYVTVYPDIMIYCSGFGTWAELSSLSGLSCQGDANGDRAIIVATGTDRRRSS